MNVEDVGLHVLAQLQNVTLWPPEDAIARLVDAIGDAWQIGAAPPPPHPANVHAAAATWAAVRDASDGATRRTNDVAMDVTPAKWEGLTGDALRLSVTAHSTRLGSVRDTAHTIADTLGEFGDAMTQARRRHDLAAMNLIDAVRIRPSANPINIMTDLSNSFIRAAGAVNEMVASYHDAQTASDEAARKIRPAIDRIQLPSQVPSGSSAVDVIDGWTGPTSGPLKGSVLDRATHALDALSPQDRARVQALLDRAQTPEHKAWILAALASGADPNTLTNFADRIAALSPDDLSRLDPSTEIANIKNTFSPFLETDPTTCGPLSLVVARMINDPVYALQIMTGYNAIDGTGPPPGASGMSSNDDIRRRIDAATTQMHLQTNIPIAQDGTVQMPWPQQIGTQPYAAANAMNGDSGVGVSGTNYRFQLTDPADRQAQYDQIASAASAGHAVPVYTGNPNIPRHIVLVTGTDGEGLTIYDPDFGGNRTISRSDFLNATMSVSENDNKQPWGAVLPE